MKRTIDSHSLLVQQYIRENGVKKHYFMNGFYNTRNVVIDKHNMN